MFVFGLHSTSDDQPSNTSAVADPGFAIGGAWTSDVGTFW